MKRVFALLCALAVVLPMICTGAAAAEPEEQQQEQYVFEKMPDIMYLDEMLVFPFLPDSLLNVENFYCETVIPAGSYLFEFLDYPQTGDILLSSSPVLIDFVPYMDEDGTIYDNVWSSVVTVRFSLGNFGEIEYSSLQILVFEDFAGITGTFVVWTNSGSLGEAIMPSRLTLTRVDDPDDTIITVDGSAFSDFSYSNLSIIMLCGLGLSAGPALFWFAYRVIKKKVSRAFFNGKL